MASYASSLLGLLGRLSWLAARTFFATLLAFLGTALVLAVLSLYVLGEHPAFAAVAMTLAIAESLVCGFVVGVKRASAVAVAEGLRTAGKAGVGVIFERLLGVDKGADSPNDEAADGRVPLAEAERRLSDVMQSLVRDGSAAVAGRGWIRGLIGARMLFSIGSFALWRFRAEDADGKGVDLAKVRGELEDSIEGVLADSLKSGAGWLMAVVLSAMALLIIVQVILLRVLAG